jgi:hypothetical protein
MGELPNKNLLLPKFPGFGDCGRFYGIQEFRGRSILREDENTPEAVMAHSATPSFSVDARA